MAFRVKPTGLAAQQIRDEARWWRRNRTRARGLFRAELKRAFTLIAEYPEAGAVAEDVELAGVRRVLLVITQHYVYYRVNKLASSIEVLAVGVHVEESRRRLPARDARQSRDPR